MIRYIRLLANRFATCLAVAAALAFVADGALGADHHHLGAAPAGSIHYHAHAHSQVPAGPSDHQLINGDVANAADSAAAPHGSLPASGPDTGCCCFCASCAAIVLPCLNVQSAPFVLLQNMIVAHRGHDDGVVPDGLRRPPRPIAIT